MYSSYTAASFARKHDLADKHGVNLEGALTWAFEFEDQPYFAGFRALATNGIDLPVLNVFRMFSQMGGRARRRPTSDGAVAARRDHEGRRARAARRRARWRAAMRRQADASWPGTTTTTTCPARGAEVSLTLEGLRLKQGEAKLHALPDRRRPQQRVHGVEAHGLAGQADRPRSTHSWRRRASSRRCQDRRRVRRRGRPSDVRFTLPRQGVSLLVLEW